jgi:hypothetical protein
MASYLLVRDRDGAIVGELDSVESALRMLKLLGDTKFSLRDYSVIRLDDSPGEIISTSSVTAVRPAGFSTQNRRPS